MDKQDGAMASLARETQDFWHNWLTREESDHTSEDLMMQIRAAGDQIISDDPEHWNKTSMRQLWDTAIDQLAAV